MITQKNLTRKTFLRMMIVDKKSEIDEEICIRS